jgi:FlaA1/EpsC-like NDP-sugar epimerase
LFTFAVQRVVWMARTLTRSASTPSLLRDLAMAILLIILLITIGLSVRAGLYGRVWRIAESEANEDSSWLIETCARTFVLVLLSLLGLLALGMLYGNVLGATNMSNP